MKTLESYLLESLETHINIDYAIYENAGLYDGIEDLCRFLTNKIKSHQEKEFKLEYRNTDRELSKFRNVFFDSIILDCERSNKYNNDAECSINKIIDLDKNTNRLKNVVIKVYLSQKHDAREVYMILLHEVTHLWDNYNHIIRYNKTVNSINTSRYYDDILKSMNDDNIVGTILYFINPIEINAWLASFAGYLYDNIEDNVIDDPKRALEIIKDSELYKNYVAIGQYVEAVYNGKDELLKKHGVDIHEFCKEYNRIYGTNFTENKVRKQIYNQYQKVRQKIESNIGKICTKYVKDFRLR